MRQELTTTRVRTGVGGRFPGRANEGSRAKSPRTEGRGPSGGSYEPIRVDALCGSDDPRGQDRPMAWFPTREEDLEAAGLRNSGPRLRLIGHQLRSGAR